MANRKTAIKLRNRRPRLGLAALEQRVEALERRVAILEAKQPQPTLGKRLTEAAPPGRQVGLSQEE